MNLHIVMIRAFAGQFRVLVGQFRSEMLEYNQLHMVNYAPVRLLSTDELMATISVVYITKTLSQRYWDRLAGTSILLFFLDFEPTHDLK
jgi:hypothetical protein